jgi:hypothetical protein
LARDLWSTIQPDRVTAIVGSGGKTSLLFALAAACPHPAVTTTTTKIFMPSSGESPRVVLEDEAGPEFMGRLAGGLAGGGRVTAARGLRPDGKLEGLTGAFICRLADRLTDAFFLSRPTARPAGPSRPPGKGSRSFRTAPDWSSPWSGPRAWAVP